ncbi:MAG: phytanoyl-CoA dioxygenase family protein [Flavobacteriales bacterium]|nr:phytanoyl-CoA dioxygenase family protein [Flavobacteriales bacterium]
MLFQSPVLNSRFALDGYVTVPFLSEAEVAALRAVFHETLPTVPAGFHSSSFSTDTEEKQRVNDRVEEVFGPKVSGLFNPIRKLGSCFLSKSPGPQGEMPIHQDWTMVDETRFCSVTIWCALQDTDEANGAVQVIAGSHRFSDALRSPTLPDPFRDIHAEMRPDLRTVPLKAGEAIIFNQALLHASPPNTSAEPRIAVTYGLIAEEAGLLFYHRNEEGQVEQFAVPDHFFQEYNTQIGQRPSIGTKTDTFAYTPKAVTLGEYQRAMHNYQTQQAMMSYKMIPLFRDAEKQIFFEKEGFAVFPLLNADEVTDLKSYYESLNLTDVKGYGFHVSMDQADKELCRRVREKIWGVALPRMEEHLKDFKPFVSSFVVKEPNPKGVVPAHQDWSFVDREEDGFCSITCWIALVDTDLENGGLGVIRGSHRFMRNKRPSPSPQTPVPLSDHMFSIFPYLHTLNVKAGELLMFDNRTFHASPPNTTDFVRLAAGVGITQKDAQLVHYYMKPDGQFKTMLRYNVDPDFFLKYENASLSKMYDRGELIEGYGKPVEVPYEFTDYTSEELVAIIKAAGNEYNVPMCEKLAATFGNINAAQQEQPIAKQEPMPETAPEPEKEWVWVDDRNFFEKYSPKNIVTEVKRRLVGV